MLQPINNQNLVNRKIKIDFDGNLYVEVNDENNPTVYQIVYLTQIPEPELIHQSESVLGKW